MGASLSSPHTTPALPPALQPPFTAKASALALACALALGGCATEPGAGTPAAHAQLPRPQRLPFRPQPRPCPQPPQRRTGMKKALFNGAMPLPRRRWPRAFGPTRCATCWPRPNGSPASSSWTARSQNSRAPLGVSGQRRVTPARQPGPCQAGAAQHPTAGCRGALTACPPAWSPPSGASRATTEATRHLQNRGRPGHVGL